MPVKKNKLQKEKTVQKAIKQAVDKLPELIREHAGLPKPINNFNDEKKKKRWLWIGVIAFTAMIFALWIFNIQAFITRTAKQKQGILNSTAQDFKKLLNNSENKIGIQQTDKKNAVKQELANILNKLNASSAN